MVWANSKSSCRKTVEERRERGREEEKKTGSFRGQPEDGFKVKFKPDQGTGFKKGTSFSLDTAVLSVSSSDYFQDFKEHEH
jgi:hypothetical protein